MARPDKSTLMTVNPLRSGNPIASITRDANNHPTTIVYNTIGGDSAATETVLLSYSDDGHPIFKGVTYTNSMVNEFQATIVHDNLTSTDDDLSEQTRTMVCLLEILVEEQKKVNMYFSLITGNKL